MEEKIDLKIIGLLLMVVTLGLCCGLLAVHLKDTNDEIRKMKTEISQQMTDKQEQIDGLSTDIDSVSQDLNKVKQDFKQDLDKIKAVQSNTNKALTRLRKTYEKEVADIREELKND